MNKFGNILYNTLIVLIMAAIVAIKVSATLPVLVHLALTVVFVILLLSIIANTKRPKFYNPNDL